MASSTKPAPMSLNRRASDLVMDRSVANEAARTPEKSFRTDSHPTPTTLGEVRGVSHVVRIDAKSVFLADINEVKARLQLTAEVMAINAGCTVSAMSEALAGKEGRNFAGHWLIAQGDDFMDYFDALRAARRGRTPEVSNRARVIVEVVHQLVEKLA
jgi:hypothetical protein